MTTETTQTRPAARDTKPEISIHNNDCCLPAACPICDAVFNPGKGLQLFLATEPVCERCARTHNLELFELWQHGRELRAELEIKRQELLAEAAKKPVRHLFQYDCFFNAPVDNVTYTDTAGDNLCGGAAFDLRNMDCLRVTVPIGTKREDALRGLGKIVQWIRMDPQELITSTDTSMVITQGPDEHWRRDLAQK